MRGRTGQALIGLPLCKYLESGMLSISWRLQRALTQHASEVGLRALAHRPELAELASAHDCLRIRINEHRRLQSPRVS